ncbi:hypothetical protein KP509_30G054500 [Ceratopteris richardii]|uniref:Uncharacterized protein n=1 Tax=Ceratopteris richardii TaxID=49495 RepID=A0A8T2R4W0_CERRI|nr:hypothetical protein KP509_30G054500 [Ceratopteris richardii]
MCIAHAHTEESHVNSIMNTQQFLIVVYLQVIKYRFLDFSLQQNFIGKDKWALNTTYNLFNGCRYPPSHSSPECRTRELLKNTTISLTRGDVSFILTDDRAEDNQFQVFDPGISFLPVHCML